jgi:NAD-dependent dihydropyrimidine dehydrogenase PreA subunit
MLQVQEERCDGCGTCVEVCPVGAVQLVAGRAQIDRASCTGCMLCLDSCPNDAIVVVAETAPAAAAEVTQASPAAPSQEIITVRLPPPPTVAEPASPLTRVMPAVGATLATLGRELGWRLAYRITAFLEDLLDPSSQGSRAGRSESLDRPTRADGRGGRRRRRRRGGR